MRKLGFFALIKKSAAESNCLLQEEYVEHALSETTCRDWFRRFKSGDFDLKVKDRPGQPNKIWRWRLKSSLYEDRCQTLKQLSDTLNVTEIAVSKRLHSLGLVQKAGNWLTHELSERQLEKRKTIRELVLEWCERKSFLHRIVTGDGKWNYCKNPKRRKAWVLPGERGPLTPKRNIHAQKVMLCIWWDQEGMRNY